MLGDSQVDLWGDISNRVWSWAGRKWTVELMSVCTEPASFTCPGLTDQAETHGTMLRELDTGSRKGQVWAWLPHSQFGVWVQSWFTVHGQGTERSDRPGLYTPSVIPWPCISLWRSAKTHSGPGNPARTLPLCQALSPSLVTTPSGNLGFREDSSGFPWRAYLFILFFYLLKRQDSTVKEFWVFQKPSSSSSDSALSSCVTLGKSLVLCFLICKTRKQCLTCFTPRDVRFHQGSGYECLEHKDL